MSAAIETTIEPPHLHSGESENESGIEVHVGLTEQDLTHRAAACSLPVDASDAAIATAICDCVRGLAEMRGPGLVAEVRQRIIFR